MAELASPRLALFDDFPHERGHHPDFMMGLGAAAGARLYCPPSFLDGRDDVGHLPHLPMSGAPDRSPEATTRNLRLAYDDAQTAGCDVLVNLFIDENWDSFPIRRDRMRMAHSLHRPGELTGRLGGVNAVKSGDAVATVRELARQDLFIVHTPIGERQARQWLPAERVIRIGWPAARAADIRRRFASPPPLSGDGEPYVLMMGEALAYKGIHCLLEAVSNGPLLRIAGNLAVGDAAWLAREYPKARVTWEPGWVTRARMDELLEGAAVVAFPYLDDFADHGGISAALVHALCYAKPVVVSTSLAGQVPNSVACPVVAPVADALADALARMMADPIGWHEAVRALEPYFLREHTYEAHVDRLLDRLTA
ncbi:MAG TPA: glycosyltransferase [Micromonosporaceae bacterium]